MPAQGRVKPARLADHLAEASRLDVTCNIKEWKRAVVEAARKRASSPAWVPRDWALEIQIALNHLLLLRVREIHGLDTMILVRNAFRETFIEQVATTGASAEMLERVDRLQTDRFSAMDELSSATISRRGDSPLIDRIVANVAGTEAVPRPGADKLRARLADFQHATVAIVGVKKRSEQAATR
jgi:hypothetical protein